MCCCPTRPSINGTPGAYSWDGKTSSTHPVNPPDLAAGDDLLHDLPGRCGGGDSHSYHLRIVKAQYGGFALLVRHGAGDERLALGRDNNLIAPLAAMDDSGRYWFLMRLYHVMEDHAKELATETDFRWRKAAAEKRIKVRKMPGRDFARVWIEASITKKPTIHAGIAEGIADAEAIGEDGELPEVER